MSRRARFAALVLATAANAGLVWSGPRAASAQQPRHVIVRETRVGLLDTHYHGWVPVQVWLENPGPATTVEIVAKVTRRNDVVGHQVRQAVVLPTGANRRETVYVLVDGSCNQVDVEVNEGGRRLDGQRHALDFDDLGNNLHQPVHAIVVHHDASTVAAHPLQWLSWGGDGNDEGAVHVTSATADPALLPERPEGYDGIDLVAFSGTGAADLAGDRIAALKSWLRRGGRVLLLPGENPAWFRDELVRSLLPEDLSVHPVSLDRLPALRSAAQTLANASQTTFAWPPALPFQGYDLQSKVLAHEGNTLAREDRGDEPISLVSVFPYGQGEVVTLAVDVEQPPFDRWTFSKQALAQALFQHRGRVPRERSLGLEPDLRGRFAHALNVSEAPSPLLIVPAVILYILIVGPINQKLLRRQEAQVLIVATTPLVALVFTGVIFAMGYLMTGLATVVLRTTVIEARSGEPLSTERTAVSIHSSTSSTYKVSMDSALLSTRVYLPGVDLEKQTQEIVAADGKNTWGAIPLNLWEHAFFTGIGLRNLGGKGVTVQPEPRELTILNGSALALGKGLLVTKGAPAQRLEGLLRVPPIAAGGKVTVSRLLPEGTQPVAATTQDAANYFVEGLDAQKFVNRVLSELQDRVSLRGHPCYVAFLDASPSAVEVDGRARAKLDAPFLVVSFDEDRP